MVLIPGIDEATTASIGTCLQFYTPLCERRFSNRRLMVSATVVIAQGV